MNLVYFKKLKEMRSLPLPILISILGLIIFVIITTLFSFKDRIFSRLYPKQSSLANNEIETVVIVDKVAQPLGLAVDKNMIVKEVAKGHKADHGGVKNGDKILKIAFKEVKTAEEALAVLAEIDSNEMIFINIKRGNKELVVPIQNRTTPSLWNRDPHPTSLPSSLRAL